jgi:ribosomal protein L37E
LGKYFPQNHEPRGRYYLCHNCGHRCFVLSYLNCPACGSPFVKYDKHMKVLPDQMSLEETGAIKLVKK